MLDLKRSSFMAMLLTMVLAMQGYAQPADDGGGGSAFDASALIEPIVLAIVFTVIGMILFGICLLLIVKITPFSVRKEIEEDQNTALGIIIGAMILGIAIILAAALHGG